MSKVYILVFVQDNKQGNSAHTNKILVFPKNVIRISTNSSPTEHCKYFLSVKI